MRTVPKTKTHDFFGISKRQKIVRFVHFATSSLPQGYPKVFMSFRHNTRGED